MKRAKLRPGRKAEAEIAGKRATSIGPPLERSKDTPTVNHLAFLLLCFVLIFAVLSALGSTRLAVELA